MLNAVLTLLLALQQPSVAQLLDTLKSGDLEAREKAEAGLAAMPSAALAEVEAALSSSEDGEFCLRLKRVARKLTFAELLAQIPTQFSDGFRASSPELLERLKKAEPGTLI